MNCLTSRGAKSQHTSIKIYKEFKQIIVGAFVAIGAKALEHPYLHERQKYLKNFFQLVFNFVGMNSSFATCKHSAAGIFLKHFWQTEGSPNYHVEYILPKGEIELIFSFADTVGIERNGKGMGATPRCFVNGMSDNPVRLLIPSHQSFFGVVLHPAAVKKLLFAPCGIFLNNITDLELVDKSFSTLWYQLAERRSFEERAEWMQQWVLSKLATIHQQELALSQFLHSKSEVTSVTSLASTVCYSTRQLNRKVQELFGMSSEVLLRYRRYIHALNLMHHSNETLTRISYDCGYYDQAHFNREFKEYTSLTPGAYRQQRSHLPGHLFE